MRVLLAAAVAVTAGGFAATPAHAADPAGTVVLTSATTGAIPNTVWVTAASATRVAVQTETGGDVVLDNTGAVVRDLGGDYVGEVTDTHALVQDADTECMRVVTLATGASVQLACGGGRSVLGAHDVAYVTFDPDTGDSVARRRNLDTGVQTVLSTDLSVFGEPAVSTPNGFVTEVNTYDEATGTATGRFVHRTWANPSAGTPLQLTWDANISYASCGSANATLASCRVSDPDGNEDHWLVPLDGTAPAAAPGAYTVLAGPTLRAWLTDDFAWQVSNGSTTVTYPGLRGGPEQGGSTLVGVDGGVLRRFTGPSASSVIPFDAGMAPLATRQLALGTGRVAWNDTTSATNNLWSRSLTRSGSTITPGAVGSPLTGRSSDRDLAITSGWTLFSDFGGVDDQLSTPRVIRDGVARTLGPSSAAPLELDASGSRALVTEVSLCDPCRTWLYDLARATTIPLDLGPGYVQNLELWGDFVAAAIYDPATGVTRIVVRDLVSGSTRTLGSGEVGLNGFEDGKVLWSRWSGSPQGYLVTPVVAGSSTTQVGEISESEEVSELTTNGYLVTDWDTGVTQLLTPAGLRINLPQASRQVHDDTVAWVGDDGRPRVAPLPHAVRKPAYLGNLVAPTSLTNGSWKLQVQASDQLTTCAVSIRNAANAEVRNLPCDPNLARLGEAAVTWDGRTAAGEPALGGSYSWRLTAGNADGVLQDRFNAAAANLTGTIAVAAAPSTIALSYSPNPTRYGAARTITAKVMAGSRPATGSVSIRFGAATPVSVPLTNGVGTLSIGARKAVGTYAVSAAYAGNTAVAASTRTMSMTIYKGISKVFESFPSASQVGAAGKGTVTVKIVGSTVKPTGTVVIRKGTRILVTKTLTRGQVAVTLPRLARGTHTLTIVYKGNANVKRRTLKFGFTQR